MDKLWAPWRISYISKIHEKQKGCVFCKIAKDKRRDKPNYIIARGKHAYIVLNLYPYNNGHLMVIPYRHVSDTSKLSSDQRADLYDMLEQAKEILQDVLKPHGFNIGINVGRAAGAGFPGHVHIHVVPRWKGDVNFMPVVTNTKIISQSLKELHKLLSNAYKNRY